MDTEVKRMSDQEIYNEIAALVDARYKSKRSSMPNQRELDLRAEQQRRDLKEVGQ